MTSLLKNYKILILVFSLLLAISFIGIFGVKFGTDFSGGTVFQIKLLHKANQQEMQTITSVIEHRINSFGLKDITVTPEGSEFVRATIAETEPGSIEEIERILRKQGKFEVVFDGNVLFTGADIIQIITDPTLGYKVYQEGKSWRWVLPFVIKENAAQNFSKSIFHRCTITGTNEKGERQYDCDKTYFFIDRPNTGILIIPKETFAADSLIFSEGSYIAGIPQDTDIEEFLTNVGLPYLIVENELNEGDINKLSSLDNENKRAYIPKSLSKGIREKLISLGFELKEIEERENYPWVWIATGAQTIISLTPSVTNMEPYVKDVQNAKIFSNLLIQGSAATKEDAYRELKSIKVILETGSLPIPIDDISKEVMSPTLGYEFLNVALIMGICSLITVSLVVFLRYKYLNLAIPIIFTAIAEVTLVLGIAALINWNLDLASVAGLVAAVGTGVNDQIVITDELIARKEEEVATSLLSRIKRAFFVVVAAASTTIAALLPLLILGSSTKLVGFAFTTICGVLVGVLITRPAYSEVAKIIIEKEQIK
ncbi:MAG: hypothetical protein N3D73_02460 [Candidatus Diapherotrites archaeon]|nr:hypothetical protein [Candidatus Diapherotrites archaeon]